MPDEPPPEPDDEPWSPGVERWVMPFLREPALWPVAVAVVGHVVVLLAVILLTAARSPSPWAWAALILLGLSTGGQVVREIRATGRPGLWTGTLLGTWAAAAGLALLADRLGVY